MGKKKNTKYEKKEEKILTAKDIKEMIVRDSHNLGYSRINVTIPTPLKIKVDRYFKEEPRSHLITRLLLEKVSEMEKEEIAKREAKKFAKNQKYYKEIQKDFEKLGSQSWDEI